MSYLEKRTARKNSAARMRMIREEIDRFIRPNNSDSDSISSSSSSENDVPGNVSSSYVRRQRIYSEESPTKECLYRKDGFYSSQSPTLQDSKPAMSRKLRPSGSSSGFSEPEDNYVFEDEPENSRIQHKTNTSTQGYNSAREFMVAHEKVTNAILLTGTIIIVHLAVANFL